jgi:predicted dienelactone hydrolase
LQIVDGGARPTASTAGEGETSFIIFRGAAMLRGMSTTRPVVAIALALFAGCSHDKHTADYVADGSFGIGVHTFTFVDTSRVTPANGNYAGAPTRTLVVDLWYPSTMSGGPRTDPPFAKGQYPLILHSHGFMDSRHNEAYLGEHLATHGYLVAAPDYPLSMFNAPGGSTVDDVANQPLDARFVLDQLLAEAADPSSPFFGAIDATKIAASGLSLGGLTTLLLAFHPTLRDPRVKAAMAWAAPSCMFVPPFFSDARLPLLLLHGDSDLIVPIDANSRHAFSLTQSPSELIVVRNGSHTGFAGPAAYLDQKMHVDVFGCNALGMVKVSSFASLGTMAQGIDQDTSVCPQPCQVTPTMPALEVDRQHDLTKALAQSFFEANLFHDGQAQKFVQARAAAENPELSAQLK